MIRSDALRREVIHQFQTAEDGCISYLNEHLEDIHSELVAEAKALVKECAELIKEDFKERKLRRPPLALACKVRSNQFGPSLVWLRYPVRSGQKKSAGPRYATEVPGRRNHLYPTRIFARFEDSSLIEQLVDIEKRAGELRLRTSRWNGIQTAIRQIQDAQGK